jgi:hypothetical protein
VQAAPIPAAGGAGEGHGGEVVKVHILAAASGLPNVSFAPVVTVTVRVVLAGSLAAGVKVATSVADTYVTCPATLAPALVTVNVEALIVAGFITLLNVAVITAVLGQTRVEASGGVTDVTAGGVKGLTGFDGDVPAFLSLSLQPAIKLDKRNAAIHHLPSVNLYISFSCSTGDKASF